MGRRSRDPNDSGTVPVHDDVDFIAGLQPQIAPDLLGDGDLTFGRNPHLVRVLPLLSDICAVPGQVPSRRRIF